MGALAPDAANGQVISEHVSPDGPVVTHMRGIMIVNGLENLKQLGLYERYLDALPDAQRDSIRFCIATDWLPIDLVRVHYETCDRLDATSYQMEELGALMAKRVSQTWYAGALRKSRSLGFEGLGYAASRVHILAQRMYKGGACAVIENGPKDLTIEVSGYPHATSRYFRTSYASYCRASASMFCKTLFVKPVRARVPHPHTVAMLFSWV